MRINNKKNIARAIALTLALAFSLSAVYAVNTYDNRFTDVKTDAWYYDAVVYSFGNQV